jgi:hypothetical protein
MFNGRRSLLLQVPESNLIPEIFGLLEQARAAQLVSLLSSLSSCEGLPISVNQNLICDCLLKANMNLLPICRLQKTNSKVELFIHVSGSPGSTEAGGQMSWHCLNDIQDSEFHSIMTDEYFSLTPKQKDIRYFARCQELYSQLTLGRNQKALKMLLQKAELALGYAEILNFMQEETLPGWIRAQYTKLMLRLYVDRYPQSQKTVIHFTRVWSEVKVNPPPPQVLARIDHQALDSLDIPTCTDGYAMVMDLVPVLLQKVHGKIASLTKDKIEFLSSVVSLAHQMIDFGFWVDTETCDPAADYSNIKVLFDTMFELLTEDATPLSSSNSNEGLVKLRRKVLAFLQSLSEFRTNKRISIVTNAYEKMFNQLEKKSDWSALMGHSAAAFSSTRGDYDAKRLQAFFQPCDGAVEKLEVDLFNRTILSDTIKTDTYCTGRYDEDVWIRTMQKLCQSKDAEINRQAISSILRNMYA